MSEAYGIHQSDILIHSAIEEGIEDLRRKPYLLDYVFASLVKDDLTKKKYGQRVIDQARKWFLSTNIPVFMSTHLDAYEKPCISITLLESAEAEYTLGDVHYEPQEDHSRLHPALCEPFTPSYVSSTGTLTLPSDLGLVMATGMVIVDHRGRQHEILEVDSDTVVKIKAGTVADFRDSVIKGQSPSQIITWESMTMKETYHIGCHVGGEQTHLAYLHSILVFVLLRYKERLLEARGFERSTVQSSDFRMTEGSEADPVGFSRHLNLTGYVRQVWPKDEFDKITSTTTRMSIDDSGHMTEIPIEDSAWVGDEDVDLFGNLIK